VLSELDSEYIVKYHDRIIDPDITTLYIIMEYCAGGDLASLIKKCKRYNNNSEVLGSNLSQGSNFLTKLFCSWIGMDVKECVLK
jgi:Protein kinase domain.